MIWRVGNHWFMFPKVTLLKTLTKEKYKFPCERWLDTNEDDNEVTRELPAMGDIVPEPLTGKMPRCFLKKMCSQIQMYTFFPYRAHIYLRCADIISPL